jgi:hypothetical protein
LLGNANRSRAYSTAGLPIAADSRRECDASSSTPTRKNDGRSELFLQLLTSLAMQNLGHVTPTVTEVDCESLAVSDAEVGQHDDKYRGKKTANY